MVAAEAARLQTVPAVLERHGRERSEGRLAGAEELVAGHVRARQRVGHEALDVGAHLGDLRVVDRLFAPADGLVLEQAQRLDVAFGQLPDHRGVPEADGQARLHLLLLLLGHLVEAAEGARQRVDGLLEDLEAARHPHAEAEARVAVLLEVVRHSVRSHALGVSHGAVSPGSRSPSSLRWREDDRSRRRAETAREARESAPHALPPADRPILQRDHGRRCLLDRYREALVVLFKEEVGTRLGRREFSDRCGLSPRAADAAPARAAR